MHSSPDNTFAELEESEFSYEPPSKDDGQEPICRNRQLRQLRVREFEADSLQKENPQEACLGSVIAGLLDIEGELRDVIDRALVAEPANVDSIGKLSPVISMYLKFSKQLASLVRINQEAQPRGRKQPNVKADGPLDRHGVWQRP